MSASQVIALAHEAMRNALESEGQAAEASSASTDLKSGVTIDLSCKGIQNLPEEVVDIMKNKLERSVYAPLNPVQSKTVTKGNGHEQTGLVFQPAFVSACSIS